MCGTLAAGASLFGLLYAGAFLEGGGARRLTARDVAGAYGRATQPDSGAGGTSLPGGTGRDRGHGGGPYSFPSRWQKSDPRGGRRHASETGGATGGRVSRRPRQARPSVCYPHDRVGRSCSDTRPAGSFGREKWNVNRVAGLHTSSVLREEMSLSRAALGESCRPRCPSRRLHG